MEAFLPFCVTLSNAFFEFVKGGAKAFPHSHYPDGNKSAECKQGLVEGKPSRAPSGGLSTEPPEN